MATLKSIEPTADNIRLIQVALTEVDCMVQSTREKVDAAAASIRLMLLEPDSERLRKNIKSLCELIEYHVSDAENYVNAEAENWGANYIDLIDRAIEEKMSAAARTSMEVGHG